MRNEDIRLRLGQEGILDVVRRRQEKCKKRLEEMNDDRKIQKVYEGELEGKRPRGRPQRNELTILNKEKLLSNYLHIILLLFI